MRPPGDSGARTSLRRRVLTRRCFCSTPACRPVLSFPPLVVVHLRAGALERAVERFRDFCSRRGTGPEKDEKFSLLRSWPQRQLQVKSFIVGDFSVRTSRFEGKCAPTSFVALIDDSFLFSCLNAELRSGTAKLCQEQVRPGQPAHLRAGLVPAEARLLRGGALSSARPN